MQRKHIIEDPAEGEAASDPMDIWLKQQLGGLHSEMLSDELPDELGALAAALEARLRGEPAPDLPKLDLPEDGEDRGGE